MNYNNYLYLIILFNIIINIYSINSSIQNFYNKNNKKNNNFAYNQLPSNHNHHKISNHHQHNLSPNNYKLLSTNELGIYTLSKKNFNIKKLTILIPTITRINNNLNYLTQTLNSIDNSIKLLNINEQNNINIYIINTINFLDISKENNHYINNKLINPLPHYEFEQLKLKYSSNNIFKFYSLNELISNNNKLKNKYQYSYDYYNKKPFFSHILFQNYSIVRKQTLIIAILSELFYNSSEYLLFHEDDMLFCKNSLNYIMNLLNLSIKYHNNNFSMIKYSYGMNGILIPSSDALFFSSFLLKYSSFKPVDHLTTVYNNKEVKESKEYLKERYLITSKYNLFTHIGKVSTIRNELQHDFPKCFALLQPDYIFPIEAFQSICFNKYDFSPCTININNNLIDIHDYYLKNNSITYENRPLLFNINS